MYIIKVLFALCLGLAVTGFPVWADSGISTSTNLSVTVSSIPEAKLAFSENITFPLLQGDGPFTRGNNLRLGLAGDITPVSMNGTLELALTPLAFFQVIGGGKLGSGWNVPGLANGLGFNIKQADGTGKIEGEALDGLVWKVWGAGLLQFDLAAIVPGDWNHLVFQTKHELSYRAYTQAGEGESWLYEADGGENRNGLTYAGMYLLGYQMPASPILNMVAFMLETSVSLYDTPNRDAWGDDLMRFTLSHIYNFNISRRVSTALILQMGAGRNFTNYPRLPADRPDPEKGDPMFYQDRVLDKDKPLKLNFSKFAAIVTVKIGRLDP